MFYELFGNIELKQYRHDYLDFFEEILNTIETNELFDKEIRTCIEEIGYGVSSIGFWEDDEIDEDEWETYYLPRILQYKKVFEIITDYMIKNNPSVDFKTVFFGGNDDYIWGFLTILNDGCVKYIDYNESNENIVCPICGERVFTINEINNFQEGKKCESCGNELKAEEILEAVRPILVEYTVNTSEADQEQNTIEADLEHTPSIIKLEPGDFYQDDEETKIERAFSLYLSCVENIEYLMDRQKEYGRPIVSSDSYVKGSVSEAEVCFDKAYNFFLKAKAAFAASEKKGYDWDFEPKVLNKVWKNLYNTLLEKHHYFFDNEIGVRFPVGATIAYLIYAAPKASIKIVFDHDKWENRGNYTSLSRVCIEMTDYGESVDIYEI